MNSCLRTGYFLKVWKKGNLKVLPKDLDREIERWTIQKTIARSSCCPNMGKSLRRSSDPGYMSTSKDSTRINNTASPLEAFMSNCKDPKYKYIATIFADIKGAFDNVWWSGLQYLIKNLELPGYLPSILGSYVDDRMVTTGISQLPRDAPRDAHRALSSVRHYGTWY
jgi:hypothetical protein